MDDERRAEWNAAKETMGNAVMLALRKSAWQSVLFSDASDLCEGYVATQVSAEGVASGATMEGLRHEPLASFSGRLKDAQLRWRTVNKGVSVAVNGFWRRECRQPRDPRLC